MKNEMERCKGRGDGDGDGHGHEIETRGKGRKRSLEEEWNPPLRDLLTRDVRCVGVFGHKYYGYKYSAVTAGRYNDGKRSYSAVPCSTVHLRGVDRFSVEDFTVHKGALVPL